LAGDEVLAAAILDRLLGVACVLLQRQVLFDPNHGAPTAP